MLTAVESNLSPGDVVGGKYRLERIIGEGGMSVVWSARSLEGGEERAIKLLKVTDAKGEARLLREARATMGLRHSAIARTFSVEVLPSGQPFIVMELLHGETLRALLGRERKLTLAHTAELVGSVVDGVMAAHDVGLVHRDLKPENIFLVHGGPPRESVRLIDFGIAKEVSVEKADDDAPSLTATGAMLGTPFYMAPEQVFGDADVDYRADVWALGIVIFECLSGRRPTDARGVGQVLKLITTNALPSLGSTAPDTPSPLVDLVDRMLTQQRDARPSLERVKQLLGTFATEEGSRASAPPVARDDRPCDTVDTEGAWKETPVPGRRLPPAKPHSIAHPKPSRPARIRAGLSAAGTVLGVALLFAAGIAGVAALSAPTNSPVLAIPLADPKSEASNRSIPSSAVAPVAHVASAAPATIPAFLTAVATDEDAHAKNQTRHVTTSSDAGGARDGNVFYLVTGDRL